jgi:hypothetical protein
MTEPQPPVGDDAPRDDDNLHVTPEVPGPSGTGEQTDRGGDDDADGVSEGGSGAD